MTSILITGATSGIGEALAKHAVDSGYHVYACGRNQQKLDELASLGDITPVAFDVTDERACIDALKEIEADIYIINAGTCEYVDSRHIEPAMFKRVFDANFFGAVNVVAAINNKLTQGKQLVFVDSLARLLPFTRSEAYGASKAALHYLSKSLEVDLIQRGVLVQSISPGFVKTPLTDKNDFSMPMLVTAERAAKDMLKGIESKKRAIYFPTRFSLMLRAMNLLPERLQRKLCVAMKRPPKKENKHG
ncbi:SDR family NAD(P)-dependent oxidoreductase [Aestuariibacter salexigens]|uniref:SDR family NAD(P)-dependent oxidoreductase n=1 Tax=Aestuariibacter salexigens TaxID=226010 RepID=UPI000413B278|nr:SDR family NAD(P)-dependent oxidoreductase [Aestuariibacter salexigens]